MTHPEIPSGVWVYEKVVKRRKKKGWKNKEPGSNIPGDFWISRSMTTPTNLSIKGLNVIRSLNKKLRNLGKKGGKSKT